jgi:hypothetical protein
VRQLLFKLWNDDSGALIAAEWLFMVVIMVMGLITGLVAVRDSVVEELAEAGNAITALDVGYSFDGLYGCGAQTAGTNVKVYSHRNTIYPKPVYPQNVTVDICETF